MASTADPAAGPSADRPAFRRRLRGFDPDEVRRAVTGLTDRLRALEAERDALAGHLATASERPFDEDVVTAMLGDEAARVLATAREAAAETVARAEEEAARVRAEAEDARRAEEEATKETCRAMLDETRQVRERMLRDLARRRDGARDQIARLVAERDRLLGVLAEARSAVETAEATVSTIDALADEAGPSLAPVTEPVPIVRGAAQEVAVEARPPVEVAPVPAGAAVEPPVVEEPPVAVEPPVDEEPRVAVEPPVVEEPPVAVEPPVDTAAAGADQPAPDAPPSGPDAPPSAVDALFARIRAGGAGQVARSVAAAVGDVDWGDRLPDEAAERPAGPSPAQAAVAPPAPAADESDLLVARSVALGPAEAGLARRLKRALVDEQNQVLDGLRRDGVPDDLDALVGPRARHGERFREAAEDDVEAAAFAGVRTVDPGADAAAAHQVLDAHRVLDSTLDRVVDDLVDPLRERLARCLADAAGDQVEAASLLRATYREWKTQRVDELAADLVLWAHGAAAFAALPVGTPVCWRIDPAAAPCPDADDNALAGAVPAGTPFPTGHRHPPAHPGCRCHLAETGR